MSCSRIHSEDYVKLLVVGKVISERLRQANPKLGVVKAVD